MKKLFAIFAVFGILTFGFNNVAFAQDGAGEEMVEDSAAAAEAEAAKKKAEMEAAAAKAAEEQAANAEADAEQEIDESSVHQFVKAKFIKGGVGFMALVAIALILGLALCIERIIYLNMASTNTGSLITAVESALNSGGLDAAKEVCRNTKGPVASIFYQGLDRAPEGLDMAEKSVISYGSVQMGLLEKGLSWIALFIALAPMLGFLGTVIGMIEAFDAIAAANNISPNVVADGIQTALITTVAGLFVAIILQIFYNYIVSKIDSIVNQMENASISLIDLLAKYNAKG